MTNHDEETKRKEIIEMAREAGFTDWWINPPEPERKGMCYEMLARLVEIAQAKERARHIHSATVPHVEGIGSAELMGLLENERKQARCWCQTCRQITPFDCRMVLCPDCGNKRCPKANDHRHACTGSNEPGQHGSAYPANCITGDSQ